MMLTEFGEILRRRFGFDVPQRDNAAEDEAAWQMQVAPGDIPWE